MIEKLRFHVSTAVIWVGIKIAPRIMRPVLKCMLDAFVGIPGQQHQGRFGGIITAGWWVNEEGKNLAQMQSEACIQVAQKVRAEYEARCRYLDDLLYPDRPKTPPAPMN